MQFNTCTTNHAIISEMTQNVKPFIYVHVYEIKVGKLIRVRVLAHDEICRLNN